MLGRLHSAGLNIFAIDYRGFGNSDAVHPSPERMAADTAAALEFLTSTRHIPARDIVPYGVGLGGSLAAWLALTHPELPAIVLDNPDPDPASTAETAHPSRVVPVRWLFGDSFDVSTSLARLKTPKLLISGGPNSAKVAYDSERCQALFRNAASPRLTVTLPPGTDDTQYDAALSRFLDQYLPTR
jgi:pimeloyl-ACP methyl ester carboxylesterase